MGTEIVAAVNENELACSAHVLVVDDDPSVRELVADYLTDNDIKVTALADGRDIADVMQREAIDLLVLDLRMPGQDGMQIARKMREESQVPIIILTSRKDEADRVMGLELGADDYLTKPFSPRELLAHIRALLRRARAQQTVAEGLNKVRAYRFAGFELNVPLRRLRGPGGESIPLTNGEFNLLAAFLAAPQRVLSRDQLLSQSRLHNDEVYDRSVDVKIGRLRTKMRPAEGSPELIRTERGAGYVFTAAVEILR
ncbi:MAG TPA: response regulator [Burkholderiales bacterium]|jgi:two-component system OmpR family response regulator|nr:response regulator [Burkholderiales bacterium]